MKKLIYLTILIGLITNAWGAGVPNRCKIALRQAAGTTSDIDFGTQIDYGNDLQKKKIVETILGQLKQIMELKFKLADYLEENRAIYGEFAALKVRKEELAITVKRYEEQRAEVIDKYNVAVKSLNPEHRRTILKRILEQLKIDKVQDLGRIDGELAHRYAERADVEARYVEVSTQWSPYQEYLGQIQALEQSLLETLESLKKVEVIEEGTKSSVDHLAGYLRASKSPFSEDYSIEKDCEALFDHVRRIYNGRVLSMTNNLPHF